MTGRTVPTWTGKTPDSAIPRTVKARICARQNGFCAAHPGEKLRPGHFDFDHELPLCLGGKHDEENIRAICKPAHKAKTAQDIGMKSKADRQRLAHLGLKKPKGRGFTAWRKFDGSVVRREK